ncbi:methyltransferase domain-containing protein [Pseudalkalibacillus hwajinpoensis]|uniref:methyltransferase domain-containing protein n=1 Tax=Guptibacillus hwajinpoensis TaxID=208199 RepID=UPI00146DC80B|nr:methyltransferase domain-containing protein [Pseudalkalibacillus hwajinpoensis]
MKNQLEHLKSERLSLPKSQIARLKWCGSRASGRHILQISQSPGILSLINKDDDLDMVNLIESAHNGIIEKSFGSCSSFWTGNLSHDISFPANYFDTVILDEHLEVMMETKVMENVKRLLKPNGKIILTQKLEKALHLTKQWTSLLTTFEELDKRVDSDYVSWVGRNADPTETEVRVEHILSEIREQINQTNKELEDKIQQALQLKKEAELARLEEESKLKMSIPFMRKKQQDRIELMELTNKEKLELIPQSKEVNIHTKAIEQRILVSKYFSQQNVTIVLGETEYYRDSSLKFSHQLTRSFLNKESHVIYVSTEDHHSIQPVFNGSTGLWQITKKDFWELVPFFNQPTLVITEPDLHLSKKIGRLQWKRWNIYYFNVSSVPSKREAHSFLINTLSPKSFIAGMGSRSPFSAIEKSRLPKYSGNSETTKRIVGFIGDLDVGNVNYNIIKQLLVANADLTIELIGYNVPETKPIRSSRLKIREYTHYDEVTKRIQRWMGGIVPLHDQGQMTAMQLMNAIGLPIYDIKDWNHFIQESAFLPSTNTETMADVLEQCLHSGERGDNL